MHPPRPSLRPRSPTEAQKESHPWRRGIGHVVLLGGLWLLGACAGVQEGEACNSGGFACHDEAAALECRDGHWLRIPCRGGGGCEERSGVVHCDLSANQEGDACPLEAYGQGRCADAGDALLECRQGQMVKTRDCAACELGQDGLLLCSPP